MISKMHNKLGQIIKYRGQLCVGDVVWFTNNSSFGDYKVIKLKGNTGTIKHIMHGDLFDVKFVEGTGWGYVI